MTEAYKVDHETVIGGYWEGRVTRCLSKDAAEGRVTVLQLTGSRNVRVSRDPQNDGQKLGM